MKLLISSPCGAGIYTEFMGSLMTAIERAKYEGICDHVETLMQSKESLIPRARNRDALYALEKGFDRLLSIDADISFSYEDFARMVQTKEPVVGGAYPLKTFPIVMNFIPLADRGLDLYKTHRGIDHEAWREFVHKYADSNGLVEVRRLATGFLSVSCEVLAKLSETAEVYFTRDAAGSEVKGFFNFYPVDVKEQQLRSEDWSFCDSVRDLGYKIMLDTKVRLGHTGDWTFRLGQIYGEVSA